MFTTLRGNGTSQRCDPSRSLVVFEVALVPAFHLLVKVARPGLSEGLEGIVPHADALELRGRFNR